MWQDMFVIQIPIIEKILRTVLVYAAIVLIFRVAGKRGLANLNTLDLTVLLLLSNVVQNAIIGSDNSLVGGVVGAVTLVALNATLNHGMARSDRLAHLIEGEATTIIDNGHLVRRALRKLALRPQELEHAVRMQNGDGISEVQDGRLEPGGQLLLTLKEEEQGATKADIAHLRGQLSAIQSSLAQLTQAPPRP
ncbi:MAG: YetF domain-containing protein [Nocardioidaceae bacterium]